MLQCLAVSGLCAGHHWTCPVQASWLAKDVLWAWVHTAHCFKVARLLSRAPARLWHDLQVTSLTEVNESRTKPSAGTFFEVWATQVAQIYFFMVPLHRMGSNFWCDKCSKARAPVASMWTRPYCAVDLKDGGAYQSVILRGPYFSFAPSIFVLWYRL